MLLRGAQSIWNKNRQNEKLKMNWKSKEINIEIEELVPIATNSTLGDRKMQHHHQKCLVRLPLEKPPISAIPSGRHQRSGHPPGLNRHIVHSKLPVERTRMIHRSVSHEIRTCRRNDRIQVQLVRHESAKIHRHVDQRIPIANPVREHAHVQMHIVNGAVHLARQVEQLRSVADAARQAAVETGTGRSLRALHALETELRFS